MSSKLKAAYALIWKFKEGRFAAGSEMTAAQVDLLRLLHADLFPGEEISEEDWGALVSRIAKADTDWNHQTMMVTDAVYSLREAGKHQEAEARKQAFLDSCPSAWYRGIVKSL